MSGTAIGVIIAVAVVVIAAIVVLGMRSGRGSQSRLRRKYGPEFDRLAAERGDPRAAEHELVEREKEHRTLNLHPLDVPERQRYSQAWSDIQARFLDDPRAAARQADQIIADVLGEIGYPAQDRDRQLALASVDHPRGLSEYRIGHDLAEGHAGSPQAADPGAVDTTNTATTSDTADTSDTETMRQALLHFQTFFDELLSDAHQPTAR
jgi:FtsZ-interacting cell division protein ZipA